MKIMEPSTSLNGLPEPESPRQQQESLQLQPQQQQQQESMQLQQQVPVNTGLQEVVTLQGGVQPTEQLQASVAGVGQSTTVQEESQQVLEWLDQLFEQHFPDVSYESLVSLSDPELPRQESSQLQLQQPQQESMHQQQESMHQQQLELLHEKRAAWQQHSPVFFEHVSDQQQDGLQILPVTCTYDEFIDQLQLQCKNPEKKKETKKIKERKRRRHTKSGYNKLQKILPSASRKAKVSAKVLLKEAVELIPKLQKAAESKQSEGIYQITETGRYERGSAQLQPSKKKSRIVRERERRRDIKSEFDKLMKLVPALSRNPNAKFSRVFVLKETQKYIWKLMLELAEKKKANVYCSRK